MENKISIAIFITFSVQHCSVRKLIQKHWHILGSDQILKTILPDRPQIIFKGASSLIGLLPVCRILWKWIDVFFRTSKVIIAVKNVVCFLNKCKDRKIFNFVSTSTARTFKVEPFITCSSEGVVYLIQCPCGLQHMERTKRALKVRLNEHISNIGKGFKNHSVSRHYVEVHHRDPSSTLFIGIDKYKPHWRRGSSLIREISRQEMAWIYRLKTYLLV